MKKIEFFRHNLTKKDMDEANKVMRSIFLTTGPIVSALEKKFAAYLNITEAIGLTSCTAAIHLALLRYGVGPGDEVITTPMTFVATATAIIQAGAVPVFIDVCPKSGLILPEAAEKAVTKRTKALLPVHLYGRMADMRGFTKLAKKYNLVLIEDAAHCIEGIRDGARPGQLSNAACFSFYATKSMTSGEGGALVCKSSKDAEWYRSARHHGISKNASYRYTKKYMHWDMDFMGWKYNMDDIQAALLINQIERLDEYRQRRQYLENLYRDNLSCIDGLDFMEESGVDEVNGHHLFTILLPEKISRDIVMQKLQEKEIGCAVNYRPLHILCYFRDRFKYKAKDFPNAYMIGKRTLSLPLYYKLSEQEVKVICNALKATIG